MSRLLTGVLRTLAWMAVLTLLAIAAVASSRAVAIDAGDRAALAVMDAAPPPLRGSNGFAALMLADRDVPPDRREAMLADDVAAFVAWERRQAEDLPFWRREAPGMTPAASFEALTGVPLRAPAPDTDVPCPLSGEGCLQRVAADPEGTRALLREQAARIEAVEAALAADHIASPYGDSLFSPLPPWQHLRLPLAVAALDAADGDIAAAYSRSCRLLAAARHTDRQARTLIDKLVAGTLARAAATLLLDLRRAHPVPALPGECAAATVPVAAAEAAVCEALRGEYRLQRAHGAQLAASLAGWRPDRVLTRNLLVDDTLAAAALARRFAPYCGEPAAARALAGLPPEPPPPAGPVTGPDCWAAYISCVLSNIAMPAFDGYADRVLDHAAVLRLLLAGQRVADGTASPARAAVEAAVAGYPVEYDAASQQSSLPLRAPGGRGPRFVVDFAGLGPNDSPAPRDAIAFVATGPHGRR
jgi:hypothetical protein